MVVAVEIGGRPVGPGQPVFVVAEAGVNHNGDPDLALGLVDAAAQAGADAVKFQTFSAERLASTGAAKAAYQLETTDADESQLEMLRRLELSADAHAALAARAQERGLLFLSAPFDAESADLLERLGVPAFKLASPEVTNHPLLRHVARKGKPLLLSTGMSDLAEVEAAVAAIRDEGNDRIVLLHCVSAYPATVEESNLRAMATMRDALGLPVGFSDHTTGIEAALAAVALGACVLEKHFTLDRLLPGPDHRASLEPDELARLIASIRAVEASLGDGEKRPTAAEEPNRLLVRRSLAAGRDLEAGTVLAPELLTALRPATGISPADLRIVVGRRLRRPLRRGELLRLSDLA